MIAYSSELQKGGEVLIMSFDKMEANLAMEDALFKFPVVSAAGAPEKALAKIPPGALRVRVTQHGYDPAKLEFPANQPMTLAFTRESPLGCGAEVVFPSLSIRKLLPLGETVLVSLPPQPTGEIRFSCGMGMLRGMIVAR
jgi:plastocyanin domain-containing protein